ncbi:aquaporin TIP1-3-like [Lycium barbarum]|uniref:aquaporin TIP1-3-like n=1 Tax=Lycium barbarum TaxID=112863 RepID=UPI00293EC24D|nr:aquaporin TIP1-3-like [Lycium barbarum]
MPISRIAIGSLSEATQPDALEAALAEFIAMVIYIFPIEGGTLVFSKMTSGEMLAAWFTAAISHAFALFVAVSVATNISGGHLLGSAVACLLLKFATGFVISPYPPTPWSAVIFEIVLTFGLVYTVYATTIDPKRGNLEVIAPIVIGLAVGANILSGGALYGAAMNPAAAFGQTVISWTWNNHWVYWLGTFVGAAIAALVYETFFIGQNTYEQLPSAD